MTYMRALMQVALMRRHIPDQSTQVKIDRMLIHGSFQETYDFVRGLWEEATKK